jgi:ligand-binding sensor domain-containing protein/DNA-binding CsgD family transcriptional regulator
MQPNTHFTEPQKKTILLNSHKLTFRLIKTILVFNLLFISVLSQNLFSQDNHNYYPFLKNFKRSEYKAGMQTWMISQANNGLLYFANNHGLVEFDGRSWDLYGLYNLSIIRSVLASNDDKIYVGLSNNFGYFETDSRGRLSYNSYLDLLPEKNRDVGEIWRIHNTSEGIVFQSFKNIFVIKNNQAKVYKAPSRFRYSFHINNKLYLTDQEKGILEFRNGKYHQLPGTDIISNMEVSAILPYGKYLMIVTIDHGIFIYKNKTLLKWKIPALEYLIGNQIYCALRIDENQIAFGTIQKGILITDNEGIPLYAMDKSKGLQNNTILSMFLDISGNLWLGTDNGIDLLYINSPVSQLNANQSIGTGYTAAIHNNTLYLGTNQGVFYKKWNDNDFSPQKFEGFTQIKKTKGQVWTLEVIDGVLFCGHNKGTFIIDGANATKISEVHGAWTFLQSYRHPDKIIGGTYSGLTLYEKINNKWKFIKEIDGFNESSRMMQFDEKGNLWMSHGFKGVYYITLSESYDEIKNIEFYNSEKGFQNDFGINSTRLQDQQVFLSGEGAFKYNEVIDSIESSEYFNNFFSGVNVNNAIEDIYGNIWYFENFGVAAKFIKTDGTYKDVSMPFKQLQGDFIEGFQFVYPVDKNNFLISCNNGFIHYSPTQSIQRKTPFNRYLSKVELIKTDSLIFNGHLFENNIEPPELSFSNNSLRFSFSAINYENPDKVEFTTFLEGHDREWSRWERRFEREYTNLKEGTYTFHLKARNIHNKETEVLGYTFVVSPPWKRTNLAYFIYLIAILFALLIFLFIAMKRIKFMKVREEKFQRQKYIERERAFQNEALIAEKEIIKLRNEKLREEIRNKDKELANSTMQTIQKNKFLISLKKDMAKNNGEIISETAKRHNKQLIRKIDNEINNEKNWKVFEKHFVNVHEEFLIKIKNEYPQISPAELRLCACLRMNISSKEIASLLNISLRGVEASRYRLRKALDLDRKQNLTDFIVSM